MYGTLARALRARNVEFDPATYTADVEGTIEGPAGQGSPIRITRIHVHYQIEMLSGDRKAAERAVAVHAAGCPAHESVKAAIAITASAEIRER